MNYCGFCFCKESAQTGCMVANQYEHNSSRNKNAVQSVTVPIPLPVPQPCSRTVTRPLSPRSAAASFNHPEDFSLREHKGGKGGGAWQGGTYHAPANTLQVVPLQL